MTRTAHRALTVGAALGAALGVGYAWWTDAGHLGLGLVIGGTGLGAVLGFLVRLLWGLRRAPRS